jgi:alpha-L-arabinofuranosidase
MLRHVLNADQKKAWISKDIYGHFTENLDWSTYDGIWVGLDSKIPNSRGMRNDILVIFKRLNYQIDLSLSLLYKINSFSAYFSPPYPV